MTDPAILGARARTRQTQQEDASVAMAEYGARSEATRQRSAELKAQRLAKEAADANAAAHLPDRPISPHPNLVTAAGLAQLDAELLAARSAYAQAQAAGEIEADRSAMARATRDLRYFMARRASAELVDPGQRPGVVSFGDSVTIDREDGRLQTYRIVGEDEADATRGSVSYVSPLASALLGKGVGEAAVLAGADIEIVSID